MNMVFFSLTRTGRHDAAERKIIESLTDGCRREPFGSDLIRTTSRLTGRGWQRQLGEAPAQPQLLRSPGDMPLTPAGASRRLLSASSGTSSSHTWWLHLLGLLLQRPVRCEEDQPGVPECAPRRDMSDAFLLVDGVAGLRGTSKGKCCCWHL